MLSRPNTALSLLHLQIMWSRLIAVVEEQAQTLVRTAFSTSVREAGDLSAGVFDRNGPRNVTEERGPSLSRLDPDPAQTRPADRQGNPRKSASRSDVHARAERRQEVRAERRLQGMGHELVRRQAARQVRASPPPVELRKESGETRRFRVVEDQPEGGEIFLEKVPKCLRPKRFGTGRHARRLSRPRRA